jgi:hypothetical protein
MKNLLFIFSLIFLTSCFYAQPVMPPSPIYYTGTFYYQPPQRDCTCGYVLDKGLDQWGRYWLNVQNQCSGNIKRFTFDKRDWATFRPSDGICLSNNSTW